MRCTPLLFTPTTVMGLSGLSTLVPLLVVSQLAYFGRRKALSCPAIRNQKTEANILRTGYGEYHRKLLASRDSSEMLNHT